MAKRKQSGMELMAFMPWPVCIVLGIVAFVTIRYGIGWYLSSFGGPIGQAMGKQLSAGMYTPFAWLVLAACWMGALGSYIGTRRRRHLLETQTGLDSLRAMSWREFEMLVGEAFRRQGYAIQETGLGGADGGIDLILRKDGAITLVQCKQWRTRQVPVNVAREMYGLLTHHGATSVKIVAVGGYTADAQRFAQGKPIKLIHGEALLAMVRESQTAGPVKAPATREVSPTPTATPDCPKCGAIMIQRENRRTKDRFWGCANYPACRGTRTT
jgi:restriction system protein